jgi:hypothetical protein
MGFWTHISGASAQSNSTPRADPLRNRLRETKSRIDRNLLGGTPCLALSHPLASPKSSKEISNEKAHSFSFSPDCAVFCSAMPLQGRSGSWDSSKAFSKPTAMQRMTKSVGREWYMPLDGLMQEDSFSKQCN